jgi:hypothetical protein
MALEIGAFKNPVLWWCFHAFSLTPALSRWEREKHFQRSG